MMPDISKLTAALVLGVLSVFLSALTMDAYVAAKGLENFDFGWFIVVNAGIAALVGWTTVGPKSGFGLTSALNNGFTGVLVFVICALLVQAGYEMTQQALRSSYGTVFEALEAVFLISFEWGQMLMTQTFFITFAIGAFVCGVLTEFVSQRWG